MKIILTMIALSTMHAFADTDFDKMTISEIYDRGYMLQATVNQEVGILVPRTEIWINISSRGDGCFLALRMAPSLDSLLKKGTIITFQTIGSGITDNGRDGLFSVKNASFRGLDYQKYGGHTQTSLASVKLSCNKMTFSVVENDSLEEIK
jgi:hypothetical protein